MSKSASQKARAAPWPDRPTGEVLWVHATTAERCLALSDIGHRLKSHRPDLSVLVTWPDTLSPPPEVDGCDLPLGPPPEDSAAEVRRFLDHWRPDLCIWSGGDIRRILMRQLSERKVDSLLVDLTFEELPDRSRRWLPDQRKKMLNRFQAVFTPSHEVEVVLARLGLDAQKIRKTDPLRLSTTPLGCNGDELAHMQTILGSRPSWYAAQADLRNLADILTAHRRVLRLLHRLLLIVSIRDETELPAARETILASGLQLADWDSGEEPDDYSQVLLSSADDSGLWYRIAPVSLLAGSLTNAGNAQNPLEAAALGSAILHGSDYGSHHAVYRRLHEVGAALEVDDTEGLAQAVLTLSAPDRAAEMALAGWTVVTEGANVTDQLLDQIQDLLDLREERHESP
ncbi:glycosyltransferase N-terminal domain-containing protein [Phaeobacter sp.]|uniref:3-deoxy-D-manno-octulosonic acid transferase n=1 Tax=Phaeobacter sp. TaxID=1902409 RepID=UPI0025D9FA55|nr:glycosyltransferase N-terminal domain-containing protein [Phaeobacter sp.]